MGEPFLILHRVRNQPAFDIAERIEVETSGGAFEDWWIIPTSGHRAYPYWNRRLNGICDSYMPDIFQQTYESDPGPFPDMPSTHPDHYPTSLAPHLPDPSAPSLAQRLGLVPKTPPITRRL